MGYKLYSRCKSIMLFSFFLICILCLALLCPTYEFSIFQTIPLYKQANSTMPSELEIKAKQGIKDECYTLPETLGVQAPLCVKVNDELRDATQKKIRDFLGIWRGLSTPLLALFFPTTPHFSLIWRLVRH